MIFYMEDQKTPRKDSYRQQIHKSDSIQNQNIQINNVPLQHYGTQERNQENNSIPKSFQDS